LDSDDEEPYDPNSGRANKGPRISVKKSKWWLNYEKIIIIYQYIYIDKWFLNL
jgi:hypothetical protein